MPNQKIRIQLDLTPHAANALDALKDRFNLRSRAEAVRTALAVVEWMDSETSRGRQIVAVGPNDVSYLAIPGLTISSGR